jgi:hypothetical protein
MPPIGHFCEPDLHVQFRPIWAVRIKVGSPGQDRADGSVPVLVVIVVYGVQETGWSFRNGRGSRRPSGTITLARPSPLPAQD